MSKKTPEITAQSPLVWRRPASTEHTSHVLQAAVRNSRSAMIGTGQHLESTLTRAHLRERAEAVKRGVGRRGFLSALRTISRSVRVTSNPPACSIAIFSYIGRVVAAIPIDGAILREAATKNDTGPAGWARSA